MKTFARIIVLVVALTAVQALAVQVTQVTLNYENGATVARVTADGPFQFSHQTEIPKDGKGDRMILDAIGATTGLSVKNFTELPKCGITGIRTAQYAVTPEKVVRVVFDLAKAPVYQIEKQGNSVKITFTNIVSGAFASWSSDAVIKTSAPVPTPKQVSPLAQVAPTATASSPTKAVDKSSSVNSDRLASLAGNANNSPAVKTSVTPVPAAVPASNTPSPVKVVAVENKPVTPTATAPVQTPASVVVVNNLPKVTPAASPVQTPAKAVAVETPKSSTIPVNAPAPVKAVVAETPKQVVPSVATAPTTVKPPTPPQAAPVKPVPTVAASTQIQQATSAKPTNVPATEKPAAVVTANEKSVPSPTVAVTANEKSAPAPTAVVQNSTPKTVDAPKSEVTPANKPVAEAPKAVVVVPTTPATTPVKPAESSSKPVVAVTIPNALADNSSEQIAEADELETSNPDLPANSKATSRFRRNAAADAKVKGTMVAEFPQRLVVKYEAMGNRDPFATLIDDSRTYNTPVQNRVPNIDGLRLVGIIESDRGASDNRALFEDKNGYSYILSSGDKVQRGYVLRVEDDRVYFQIFEYGWSRTVALAIENAN